MNDTKCIFDTGFTTSSLEATFKIKNKHRFDQAFIRATKRLGFKLITNSSEPKEFHIEKNARLNRIKSSLKLNRLIKENTLHDGTMYVYSGGTDCDHCFSESISRIEATRKAYDKFEYMIYDSAEGSTSVAIVSAEEALEFHPESRDYILEAHEDGHAHSVSH